MKKLFFSLTILAIYMFNLPINAQSLAEKRNELRQEILSYRQTNMKPQFDNWKTEIDRTITKDELNRLNQLREEAAKFRKEMIYNAKEWSKGNKGEFKPKNNPHKEKMKYFRDELSTIIDNHKDFFTNLFENAKPKFEQWRSDIKSKIEKWKDENQELIQNSDFYKKGLKMEFRDGMGMMCKGKNKFMIASILLYNGNIDNPEENAFGITDVNEDIDSQNTISYPNPFAEYTNIKFNLPKSGDVKITITDENGKIIETIQQNNLNAGENVLPYKPSKSIPNGLYFYKIESNNYKYTGKLIYQK